MADTAPIFLKLIGSRHKVIADCPVTTVAGDGWSGRMITVPPPPGTDLAHGLWIEEVGDEVTIGLDHSHIHKPWPPEVRDFDRMWWDAAALVDAILNEEVIAVSGWIDDDCRCGGLRKTGSEPDLPVPNLNRIRWRSWLGTFDRDQALPES